MTDFFFDLFRINYDALDLYGKLWAIKYVIVTDRVGGVLGGITARAQGFKSMDVDYKVGK